METLREAAFACKELEHKANITGDVIAQLTDWIVPAHNTYESMRR
jgi:hypothetical protein